MSDGVEVLNPDHHILTCAKGAKLRMELHIGTGRGYVPAERNKTPQTAVGVIPVDSLFSPIRKVNFQVTNARVGQQTDYDRLSLEVWTNGAVRPEDAVAFAAKILKDQLSIFINFEEGAEPTHESSVSEEQQKLSTRTSGSRSTSSSCRSARRTASRTPTSATSASWCRRPSPRC